ncbi:MAG: tail fiber domain-containing protein, partial [Aeromonas veronii]
VSGGLEKPNYFGAGKLRYQMLGAGTGGAAAGLGAYCDALWISSYTGNDVKQSNLLLMSKDSARIGFRQASYDATDWGPLYQIYHTGYKPTAADVGAAPANGNSGVDFNTRKLIAIGTGNDYHNGGVELRGNGSSVYPSLGFHQPGVFAGSIQQRSGLEFYFYAQGATSYANVTAQNGSFNDVYIRSDSRLKTNLNTIENALEKVNKLTAYTYDKKESLDSETIIRREAGIIAQDLQKVLPEAVNEAEDTTLTISNSAVNALLVEAIKELKDEIDALKKELGR